MVTFSGGALMPEPEVTTSGLALPSEIEQGVVFSGANLFEEGQDQPALVPAGVLRPIVGRFN